MGRYTPHLIVLFFGLSAACVSQGTVSSVNPEDRQDTTAPTATVAAQLDTHPPAPVLTRPAADSILEIRIAQDSAADAAVLDQLNQAEAPGDPPATQNTDPLDALADARTSTLALAAYAEHERVKYYLDFFRGPARSRMAIWLGRLPVYESMVRQRFEAAGLPSDLVYLGLIESGYSNVAVSRARATGMWQFMRGTGRWMGLRIDRWVDERRDPVKATAAAARYLQMLTAQFGGSHFLAAAAYNAGPGRVSRGLSRMGPVAVLEETPDSGAGEGEDEDAWSDEHFFSLADTRYIRKETKDYVPKLIAAALIARTPEVYGFSPVPGADPFPLDSIVVPDMTGLDVIAELAGVPPAAIRELNPHYLRSVTPPRTASVVRLPAGTMTKVNEAYAALPVTARVAFKEHVVAKGQTTSGIAKRYGVSVAALREANPEIKTKAPRPGQRLVIPAGAAAKWSESDAGAPKGSRVHTVRKGETLGGIATRYRVSVSSLRSWNNLSGNTIRAGQKLKVGGSAGVSKATKTASKPPVNPSTRQSVARTHTVRSGETLSSLAKRYGVTVQAIKVANDMSSSRLKAGQKIRIPA